MEPYRIDTNGAGRRILSITRYFDVDATEELNADDFDIVFIDMPQASYNAIRILLGRTSPLISKKCRLKPRFVTAFNRNDFTRLSPLIDGFVQSAVDNEVAVRSEEIFHALSDLEIQPGHGVVRTEKDFFIGISQYCMSRGRNNFIASTIPSISRGLSSVYSAYVEIHETVGCGNNPDDKNIRNMVQWFLEEGFVTPVKFVERIHLCPMCQSAALLFSECCQKCHSSNIREEEMIHHFRCANIAPESEYLYDGELRCPKCKHFLRHIGVDYDRPARVQTCNECGATQMHSEMKVLCSVCGNVTQPHLLTPYDIKEYAFTQEGIRFICHYNMLDEQVGGVDWGYQSEK